MIVLDFTYTRQDCARAWQRHFRDKLNMPLDLIVIAVVGVLGLLQWYGSGLDLVASTAFALSGALALIVILAYFVVPQLAHGRSDKLKRPYHLRFTDEAIDFRTDNIDSRLEWRIYDRATIDSSSYLLYHGKNEFTIIPKRVFAGPAERAVFDRLLESKIQKISRR